MQLFSLTYLRSSSGRSAGFLISDASGNSRPARLPRVFRGRFTGFIASSDRSPISLSARELSGKHFGILATGGRHNIAMPAGIVVQQPTAHISLAAMGAPFISVHLPPSRRDILDALRIRAALGSVAWRSAPPVIPGALLRRAPDRNPGRRRYSLPPAPLASVRGSRGPSEASRKRPISSRSNSSASVTKACTLASGTART
jgi:hypothetical protein